uniref:Uncharacterized protein n=1 Tax=Bionectria ochroleuca TaxID=29856 RepID=A0A8H7NFF8_BIOOC
MTADELAIRDGCCWSSPHTCPTDGGSPHFLPSTRQIGNICPQFRRRSVFSMQPRALLVSWDAAPIASSVGATTHTHTHTHTPHGEFIKIWAALPNDGVRLICPPPTAREALQSACCR